MKPYAWDGDKSEWLVDQRGVSFERVVLVIANGGLLDVVAHPNRARYPNQSVFIVTMDEYAWLVPFVETDDHCFLKTIIPSRKATRQYLEPYHE